MQNGDITLTSGQIFDPTNWTKQGLAIDNGTSGEYDYRYAEHARVLKDGGLYKMWYAGWDGSVTRILYANSIDGITWNKQGLVLDIGSPGNLDDEGVYISPVLKDGSMYKMWYAGWDGNNDRVLYANSTDGVTWHKQGLVLNLGSSGQPDDEGVRPYTVIKENGIFKMWYGGFDGSNYRMFFASSTDGTTWTKQGLVMDKGNLVRRMKEMHMDLQ